MRDFKISGKYLISLRLTPQTRSNKFNKNQKIMKSKLFNIKAT